MSTLQVYSQQVLLTRVTFYRKRLVNIGRHTDSLLDNTVGSVKCAECVTPDCFRWVVVVAWRISKLFPVPDESRRQIFQCSTCSFAEGMI